VAHDTGAGLQSHHTCLLDRAAGPKLLNHSALWQTTVTGLQVCCAGPALQPACPHVSSAFNGPPATCLTNTQSNTWKHASLVACLGQLTFLYSSGLQPTGGRGICSSIGAPLSERQSLKPFDMWQHRSSALRKAEPRAVGHVAAPELPSQEGRARSHETRGSTGAHLSKEVRFGAEGHVTTLELASTRRQCQELRDT
jgi:hypothetical protein